MTDRYRAEMTEVVGLEACELHDDTADLHDIWLLGGGMLGASLIHHGEQLLWQGAGPAGYLRERKFMGSRSCIRALPGSAASAIGPEANRSYWSGPHHCCCSIPAACRSMEY